MRIRLQQGCRGPVAGWHQQHPQGDACQVCCTLWCKATLHMQFCTHCLPLMSKACVSGMFNFNRMSNTAHACPIVQCRHAGLSYTFMSGVLRFHLIESHQAYSTLASGMPGSGPLGSLGRDPFCPMQMPFPDLLWIAKMFSRPLLDLPARQVHALLWPLHAQLQACCLSVF